MVLSDGNRKSLLVYDRSREGRAAAAAQPLRHILGPDTGIGFIAGVEVDPVRHQVYAVNNDIEDRLVVFDYDDNGNVKPRRMLYVPHQAWGVSLNRSRGEMAISVQQLAMVAIYRQEAKGLEAPLRIIRGPNTGMADAHGIEWDIRNHEIVVANHGNYAVVTPYSAYDVPASNAASVSLGGHFQAPSITTYSDTAQGDAKPLRVIQGSQTELNWPMGIALDTARDEIAVANNGNNAVLIFRRTARGNASPMRVLRGARTGLNGPIAVAIDTKNDELWVANYGDHTALVFARAASGDVAPKRILRNAPVGTPTGGFGNPYAVAYDSKREEILVPN